MTPSLLATDWTQVLTALIVGLPAILSAIFAFLIRRDIKTPSGNSIGNVAELTHDLSSADLALTTQIHRKTRSGEQEGD